MRERLFIAVALLFMAQVVAAEPAQEKKPDWESVQAALLAGLPLIVAGGFDAWIEKPCHPQALCSTSLSKKSLKRYNLPAMKRAGGHCLRGPAHDQLEVTRIKGDPATDESVRLFIACHPK